jgi:phi13 family phage major tail protein
MRVGLDKIYYAKMNDEVAETYDAPKPIPGGITANLSPTTNSTTLYADNQAWASATAFGGMEVELNVVDLPKDAQIDLLGSEADANGVLIESSSDNAPYVALGFRALKANGQYRYIWLYKGKFAPSDEEYATKEDAPEFQTPTVSATFLPRQTDGEWRAKADSDDTSITAGVITNWFASVYNSVIDTTPPTVTVSPVDNATGVAVSANVIWTFNEEIRPSDVTKANFFLQTANGVTQIAGALSLDVTKKIVTLNPTANLAAATEYMAIATVGVRDTAGNALAANSVVTFTTA